MNNKQIGTAFEREMCAKLAEYGFWVHFISPDARGAQPFDIIAVKDGKAIVGDCKTSSRKRFGIDRLEDNQIMAFEKWLACGNTEPYVFVKYKDLIRCIPYTMLKNRKAVELDDLSGWF